MNKRSAAAALKHPAGDKVSLHYPHALDYLAYSYLGGNWSRRNVVHHAATCVSRDDDAWIA